ncbi:MAG: hypothetical protein HC860_23755 [Alkalinema sp. RU_4_3]|nr:hypothetical protein [Alkalinema sp. RU_4_3]
MADVPSQGKYQSQVLNFLNRQVQDIKTRGGEVWKKIKIAAVWGAQMALYPIYAIVQASRFALHQFTQAVNPDRLTDAPPAGDRPIVSILQDLGVGLPEFENCEQITGVNRPALGAAQAKAPNLAEFFGGSAIDLTQITIIGIATDLTSQQLVLVAANGQTIALTSTQHHQLTRRILWELAQYGYDYRTYLKQVRNPAILPSQFSPNTWGIVKLFWGAMHWVHQGTIAQNLDWFGERQALAGETGGLVPTAHLVPTGDRLARAIAYFFGKRSIQVLSAGAAAGALIQPIPVQGLTRNAPTTRLATQTLVDHVLAVQSGRPIAVEPTFVQPAALPETRRNRNKLSWRSVFEIDPTDSWIETDATHVGYVKHPLERLMAWLDGGLSWLEQQIVVLWQRLTHS